MVEIFVQSLLIGYSGAVMPGSLLTFTIDKSLRHGAKSGIIVSLGHALLEFFLVGALFFGFGKYLGLPLVQTIVGILGGILLIFLGISMVKGGLAKDLSVDFTVKKETSGGSLLFSGALLSVCNPYFLIWWAVVGLSLIMNAYNALGYLGIFLFYIGHILADISWYGLIAILVSKTKTFFSLSLYRGIIIVLGSLLIIFGCGFFANALW